MSNASRGVWHILHMLNGKSNGSFSFGKHRRKQLLQDSWRVGRWEGKVRQRWMGKRLSHQQTMWSEGPHTLDPIPAVHGKNIFHFICSSANRKTHLQNIALALTESDWFFFFLTEGLSPSCLESTVRTVYMSWVIFRVTRWHCWDSSETQCTVNTAIHYRVFSCDVMAAMLVFLNDGMAAMMVFLTNPLGIEFYYHANVLFCFWWKNKVTLLIMWVKTLYNIHVLVNFVHNNNFLLLLLNKI